MLKNDRRETVKILLGGLIGLLGGISIPSEGFKQSSLPEKVTWEPFPYAWCALHLRMPSQEEVPGGSAPTLESKCSKGSPLDTKAECL